jgi:hypothetical protein
MRDPVAELPQGQKSGRLPVQPHPENGNRGKHPMAKNTNGSGTEDPPDAPPQMLDPVRRGRNINRHRPFGDMTKIHKSLHCGIAGTAFFRNNIAWILLPREIRELL